MIVKLGIRSNGNNKQNRLSNETNLGDIMTGLIIGIAFY